MESIIIFYFILIISFPYLVFKFFKNYLLIYLFINLFCYFTLPKFEKNFLFKVIKNCNFYYWLFKNLNCPIFFKISYLFSFIFFILFYPIICKIIPNFKWGKLKGMDTVFSSQISLEKNYDKTLYTFSKLFWFDIFNKYNIKTPNIYSYIQNNQLYELKNIDKTKEYIIKPIYGSNGYNISKVNFKNIILKNNYILQEYIKDINNECRTIRIVTVNIKNKIDIFFISQIKSKDIVSNTINTKLKYNNLLCKNNYCLFLSKKENIMIKEISKKLINLHKKEFNFILFIGWDVILSTNGIYLLEGNITPDINFKLDEFLDIMKYQYKSSNNT